ncbi:MAG: DsbA family oxidoreductase [Paramuribaculum sp.]|nr:DsbA family oxidoreductase [Paramuribaculum sp.]MDE6304765.1 DsbA family oxidoreductase [Paramuribaculum sp.]
MITLTIWSDFACPYCYIGETRLEKAIEELGMKNDVRIDYRAFELDPTAPKEVVSSTPERFAMKYRLSLEGAKQQIEQISDLGKELGIDFRYATTQYSNTRDAHRLMKLAEEKYDRETVARINEALFKAYFVENLVLADHKVLLDKAMGVGMKEDEVKDVLNSDKYDDEVRFDEREAAMRGIHGVPYIVFNGGFAVPGAMSVDSFKSALRRELNKQQSDTTTERPHACGPDGCQLL